MANDYFQDDGNPGYKGPLASGAIRTLFANIEAGFDKLVGLTGNGSKIVAINSAGTAQEALSTTGSGSVVRSISPTLETPVLGTPSAGVLTNCTGLPASSVVNTPAGNIAATDVQAAINELDTEKAALAGAAFTGAVTVPTPAAKTEADQYGRAGQVLQVVSAIYTVQQSSSINTYADTGLTATITPKFATSKVLVLISQNGCGKDTNNTRLTIAAFRGATDIGTLDATAGYTNSTATSYASSVCGNILDAPATTSAVTYKTQFMSFSNAAAVYVQAGNVVSSITLMEIAQ